jgi:hypothetical protein
MATRTTGAIALHPTGNEQGGYYFFSLTTGRRINCNRWTLLPMPNDVIARVRNLAQQAHANLGMLFTDRHGHPIITKDNDNTNDSNDKSYHPNEKSDIDDEDNYLNAEHDVPITGVNDQEVVLIAHAADKNTADKNTNGKADNNDEANNENNFDANDNVSEEDRDASNAQDDNEIINPMEETEPGNNDNNQPIEPNDNVLANKMDDKYGAHNSKHTLWPRQPRDYSHLLTTLECTVMTQHSMKKGLKIFGDAGTTAVLKELKQLHD